MTLAEARAELGVDGSSDGDAVRRAYLRALKQHKPERDPEGFQRVREAYDLLRGAMAFSAIDLTAAARARVDAPEPAVAGSQPGPPAPPARDEGDDAESSTAGGDEGGDDAASPAEVEPWRALAQDYRHAVIDASVQAPPAFVAIDTALELLAKSRPKAARKLLRAFKAYADTIGTARALSGGAAIGWAIAMEVAALDDKHVRTVIAKAAMRGDLSLANGALEFLRDHYPDAANRLVDTLRRSDGVLWRVYAAVLCPPPAAPRRGASRASWWVAAVAALFIVRAVLALSRYQDDVPARVRAAPSLHHSELLVFALPRIRSLAKESAPKLVGPAERARGAARKGDCGAVRATLSEMEQLSASTPDLFTSIVLRKQLDAEIERARLELDNVCN